MNKLKKYDELIRYVFIGGTTTVVSILSYDLFVYLLKLDYMTSTILSWCISVIYAYITNRSFVFKSKKSGFKDIFLEFISFISCRLSTLLLEMLIMFILVSLISVDKGISKILVQFIIFILNYLFSKLFVFKNNNDE